MSDLARPVRARFAPSPTGYFHVGSAWSSLFNWLFARRHGGTFVLRIEDTDAERNKEEWVEGIQSAMRWLGLDWDEGPYRQAQRGERHAAAALALADGGHAYWCDCTREQIDARTKQNATPGYDRFCRDRGLSRGPGTALRFAVPRQGATTVHDVIRGDVTVEHRVIEDFVVMRSNGTATFVLANVVDDLDMAITHVIRGEEHLPNTPKQLLLWAALDAGEPPTFAHLPVLVNEKRQKLSKRRDPVALEGYALEGYLPEAMRNYLALLGWSPAEDREVFTLEEMVAAFRLEDVRPSPAFFDVKKLRHLNGLYIRELAPDAFVERSRPWWPEGLDEATFRLMAPLVQERVDVLGDVPEHVGFLVGDQVEPLEDAWAKATKDAWAADVLRETREAWVALGDDGWRAEALGEAVMGIGERLGVARKKVSAPVRVALTGRTVGPPLWESAEVLGRERSLGRLGAALARL